jgi:glycogen phosphorylase
VVNTQRTGLEGNSPGEQSLTDSLYRGNSYHRLCQEVVLGMGGIAMLDALGFQNINTYHMNEGHAAFLTLALLEPQTNGGGLPAAMDWDREAVRQVVFHRPDFLTGRRDSGHRIPPPR